ncbi:MAG: gliding motility-associated C-terminal domain-containing protein [Flavobacteriales bacterium]|nr:gliding motility-associated C-terminal domain-containing protein [Flavobacteriales bacterium]MCC6939518.1 gliding motility-associated C-terminal domain-containing protein [Flavobacteriales bacterium]
MTANTFRPLPLLALLILFLSGPGEAKAIMLDPPAPRCASVNVSGDVTLTWSIPLDPGGDFSLYEIWGSNDAAGPFVLIATVPVYGQVNFLHLGAGANGGPLFYYMTTVSTGPPPNTSLPSDTIATIFLQVNQSTPLGNADLSWNAPGLASTALPDFTIWLEYPIGTWSQIATVPSTTFSYAWPVSVCEDSLTFRVGIGDGLGCTSYSSRDGAIFNDVTPPSVPVLVSVSVDPITGLSTVTWSQSPDPDTGGYYIVWNGPAGGVVVGTVMGQGTTSFSWPDSTPNTGPESFTVAAFDTCWTGSPPSANTSGTGLSHTTVFASTNYDRCASIVHVNWTGYIGWAPQNYEVSVSMDGGPLALLANVDGAVHVFSHQAQPDHNYCYVIRAVLGPGLATSLSNETCRFTDYPPLPQGNYLRNVTVLGPSSILVVDSVDQSAEVGGYWIERSANGNAYNTVASFPGTAGPVIDFTDNNVRPSDTGYRYRVQVGDSCGNPAFTSNIGANIVLRATPDLAGLTHLNWNGYIEWAGTVVGYNIYRSVADGAFELITTVPPDPWSYTDDVNAFVSLTGRFCYYVEAIEGANPSGINAISTSNVACAVQQDLVFIPNAFIIGSSIAENQTFKPVLGFVDVTEYRFLIINRWNQVIWETEDPDEAWTGVVGSQVVPIGIYAYYCAVRSGTGKLVEKRGTVMLLTAED